MSAIADVTLTPLKRISADGGDVLHAIKATDVGFTGFGEAYFSTIEPGAVKPWKRHQRMTLNLVVPIGAIRFVMYDDRPASPSRGVFEEVVLSPAAYARLTVPPMIWMAFQGVADVTAMLLNVANLSHDPAEIDRRPLEQFVFDWNAKQ